MGKEARKSPGRAERRVKEGRKVEVSCPPAVRKADMTRFVKWKQGEVEESCERSEAVGRERVGGMTALWLGSTVTSSLCEERELGRHAGKKVGRSPSG